jgi:hypothetical protein
MHNFLSEDGKVKFACYKCSEGCVHLEYANLMITFTAEQFLNFSECVTEVRRRILVEREATAEGAMEGAKAESFVM